MWVWPSGKCCQSEGDTALNRSNFKAYGGGGHSQGYMAPNSLGQGGEGGAQYSPTAAGFPRGSALANTISQFALAIFLFLYILWRRLHQATWGGKDRLLTFRLWHRPLGQTCWKPICCPCRVVLGVSAGLGLLPETGYTQHADAVHRVVGL